jgi:hypothetical protein
MSNSKSAGSDWAMISSRNGFQNKMIRPISTPTTGPAQPTCQNPISGRPVARVEPEDAPLSGQQSPAATVTLTVSVEPHRPSHPPRHGDARHLPFLLPGAVACRLAAPHRTRAGTLAFGRRRGVRHRGATAAETTGEVAVVAFRLSLNASFRIKDQKWGMMSFVTTVLSVHHAICGRFTWYYAVFNP